MSPRRSSKLTVSVPVVDIFVRLKPPKLSNNSFDSPVNSLPTEAVQIV